MQPRLLREPVRLAGLPLLRMQSDERLIRLAREGHPPAFSAIVDRYGPSLLRYCTRLVGEQRAEDAVQQALVNAHRALTEHDAEVADLRPWLYRIAHNAALNTLRGDTEGWSLDDPAAAGEGLARPAEDVATTVERREHLHHTLEVISGLPTAQRDALLLRELEGRSHAEIAGALGVTAGAARQHLMRARATVRAAAAAVTPYPLLERVASWMTLTPTGERISQVAAGAGFGAGLVKVSAGVLATSALVGGAAVGTGVAPSPLHSHHSATAAASPPAPAATVAPPVPVASPSGAAGHTTFAAGTTAASRRHRASATARSRRHGGSSALGRGRGPGAGSGSPEDRRTASSGHDGTQSTSGGSDGDREGVRLPARTSAEHTDGESERASTTSGTDGTDGTDSSGSSDGSSSDTTTTSSSGSTEPTSGATSGSSGDGGGSGDSTDSGGPTSTTDLAAPTSSTGDHTVTGEVESTG